MPSSGSPARHPELLLWEGWELDITVTDDVEMEEKQFISLLSKIYYPSLQFKKISHF